MWQKNKTKATQRRLLFGKWRFREKEIRRMGQKQKKIRQKEREDYRQKNKRADLEKVGSNWQPWDSGDIRNPPASLRGLRNRNPTRLFVFLQKSRSNQQACFTKKYSSFEVGCFLCGFFFFYLLEKQNTLKVKLDFREAKKKKETVSIRSVHRFSPYSCLCPFVAMSKTNYAEMSSTKGTNSWILIKTHRG